MENRFPTVCFLAVVVCVSLAAPARAQPRSGSQGETYASIAELPDWSGVWVIPFAAFRAEQVRHGNPQSPDAPPLAPDYAARRAAFRSRAATGKDEEGVEAVRSNEEICLPTGMPNVMRFAFAIEVLFTPGRVTILAEQDSTIRRIYTDGRDHDPSADPTYTGESIGYWEGETLVVDTTAISPKAELLPGVPSSGKAEVVERIYLNADDKLQIDTVVNDPVALTVPWRYSRVHERSDSGFFERVCLDGIRDLGGGEPDLTPPGD
jgi:hypothetical protein